MVLDQALSVVLIQGDIGQFCPRAGASYLQKLRMAAERLLRDHPDGRVTSTRGTFGRSVGGQGAGKQAGGQQGHGLGNGSEFVPGEIQ